MDVKSVSMVTDEQQEKVVIETQRTETETYSLEQIEAMIVCCECDIANFKNSIKATENKMLELNNIKKQFGGKR